MNLLRVSSIDKYEDELQGYSIIGNKIFYLTEKQFCMVRVGKFKKDSVKMKGKSIINFVISKRGYIAFLYKSKTIEIRRLDQLNEVWHRFNNILIFQAISYPKMVWDYDQLYLVYSDSLEIFSMNDKSRKGYTDIVSEYQQQKITNIIISNVMDTERAAILQLRNRLIFTIIPIPITQLYIKNINSTLSLYSPSHLNDSRKEYMAVLAENSILKIYNFLNLKQIFEVDLSASQNQFLEMESDPHNECILIRYLNFETMDIKKNVIYKINSEVYYRSNNDFFYDQAPFFNYSCEVPIQENLTLFPVNIEPIEGQVFDSYHISFFKNGQLYIAYQLIPNKYNQPLKQMKASLQKLQWLQMSQWKQIMSTYLQIPNSLAKQTKNERPMSFSDEQRQISEYHIIKKDFDSYIVKFTQKITEQSKKMPLSQKNIQEEWNQYLAKIAKENNFMLETMKLFKIQSEIIKQKVTQTTIESKNKELQKCVQDLSSRQNRIDAKIQQKKKELQIQRKEKSKVTPEEIQKYQEEYLKFVAQFLAESQRKQKEEQQMPTKSLKERQIQQKFILSMPQLTQQQKMMIKTQTQDSHSIKLPENIYTIEEYTQKAHDDKIKHIFQQIHSGLIPLQQGLESISQRIELLESNSLSDLKRNEQRLNEDCSVDIQRLVRNGFKKMFQGLSGSIKRQIESATQKIYKLQQKNIRYYDQLIEKYRQFIKFQIQHKIDIFYKSRKQLQSNLNSMIKDKQHNIHKHSNIRGE